MLSYKNDYYYYEQANRVVQTKSNAINSINKIDIKNALNTIKFKEKTKRKIGFCG